MLDLMLCLDWWCSVYVRQRRDLNFEGRKVHVILAQSISVPWFSEKSGMIRVKQYKQSLAIQSYDTWSSEGKYWA